MTRPPFALLVTGAPGAGKSTVGAELARRLRAALIDLDPATEALTQVVAGLLTVDDLDDPRLANATRAARYSTIEALAVESLRVGTDVVLVAPFTAERRDPAAWSALLGRLESAGARVVLVWLRITPAEIARRVAQRGAQRDLAKGDPGWIGRLDLTAPVVPHLVADASLQPEQAAESVLNQLDSPQTQRNLC
ncbi:MAG: ATP-binding protein [Actinobacteria bacterium]|nr:ATP-binding protein [Actinomycetota bacterium]